MFPWHERQWREKKHINSPFAWCEKKEGDDAVMGTLIHLMQKCHHKRFIQTLKKKGFVNNNLLQQVKCHFTMGYWVLFGKKVRLLSSNN